MRKWVHVAAFSSLVSALAAVGLSCGGGASDSTGFSGSGGGGEGGGSPDSVAGDDIALSGGDGGGSFGITDTGAHLGTGSCKDGTYSGTFQCTFVFNADASVGDASVSADAGGLNITGTISFQLMHQQTSAGEFAGTSTASGSFSGTAAAFFAISAHVGGTLDCRTGVFDGSLTNGMYSGFLLINGTFAGPLTSDYNGTTFAFVNGQWVLTVPGQGSCPGTWSASYVDQ
jgi:hypothetical protein